MLYAADVRSVDKMMDISLLAWRIQEAQATKTKGTGKNATTEAYYKTFKDFYDYEKLLSEARGLTPPSKADVQKIPSPLSRALLKANSSRNKTT